MISFQQASEDDGMAWWIKKSLNYVMEHMLYILLVHSWMADLMLEEMANQYYHASTSTEHQVVY
jgi:hypothetical protein